VTAARIADCSQYRRQINAERSGMNCMGLMCINLRRSGSRCRCLDFFPVGCISGAPCPFGTGASSCDAQLHERRRSYLQSLCSTFVRLRSSPAVSYRIFRRHRHVQIHYNLADQTMPFCQRTGLENYKPGLSSIHYEPMSQRSDSDSEARNVINVSSDGV
jgi:hypothetical protein